MVKHLYHRMFMADKWKSWGNLQTSLNSRLKLWVLMVETGVYLNNALV